MTLNLREHRAAGRPSSLAPRHPRRRQRHTAFVISAAAAHFLLGLNANLAILLGAILVVTGPTVIGPLLRHVRPGGQVAAILKWEGIIIDPIGAMAAIIVFEALNAHQAAALPILQTIISIIGIGALFGAVGAGLILLLFRRHWVPDFLHNSFVLVLVLVVFAAANALRQESGLFATTIMGLILANQRRVNIHHVMEFEASLSILLISALFIILGARLTLDQLGAVPWLRILLFLAVLIFIARPAAIFLCTLFSPLSWPERTFLAGLAPRGIVAASVASVFALRLHEEHFPQTQLLVPITFATIIGSVTFYGLIASPLARKLRLTRPGTQGLLIAGAGAFARALAESLQSENLPVLLVDTSWENTAAARLHGIPVLHGSVLSRFVADETQLSPISTFLALTPNDEVNALAAMHYQRVFSRSDVYQLAPAPRTSARQEKVSHELRGRLLFSPDTTFPALEARLAAGQTFKKTLLTPEFTYERFQQSATPDTLPLFVRTQTQQLHFFTTDYPTTPKPGDTLYSLSPPKQPLRPTDPATAAAHALP